MIVDKLLALMDTAEDLYGQADNYKVGKAVDLGEANRYLGGGASEPMYLYIVITKAAAGGGTTSTIRFRLRTGTGVDSSGDLNAGEDDSSVQTKALPKSDLTKGAEFVVPIPPPETAKFKRYVQLAVTDGGTALTALQAKAYLVNEVPRTNAYKDAVK